MKFISKHRQLFLLLILTIVGGLLRFWNLGTDPVSPNWDEVSHGVNAYSILLTGRDEWGKSFPLIFRAFGDYKLPLYIYLSAIPVWLFGLSIFSIRFISALAGTLAIPGIFLLTRELFSSPVIAPVREAIYKNKPVLSAFILTFLPWHFFISRPALEANLALTLIIFGSYYLIRFFKKSASLLPSVLLLGLSLHSYNTARVFVPFLVIIGFFIYRPSIKLIFTNIKNILAIITALILGGLVIFQIYLGEGTARYEKLKILSPSTVFQIGEKRAQSTLPPVLAKLVHNRPVYFVSTVSKNYLSYFSPDFFFQKWGAQYQFAIPKQNLITLPIFLLAFLGFFSHLSSLRAKRGNPESFNNLSFVYAWLFLSPLAASLTADPPQALRPNPMIPAIIIFACLGLSRLLLIIPEKKKFLVYLAFFLSFLLAFVGYLSHYFGDYRQTYSSSWQYGYRQVMEYVQEHQAEYERIFITKRYGEPHIFYSFYNHLDPKLIQPGSGNIRFEKSDWFWTDKIGKVYFVNDWQIPTITVSELPLESGGKISTAKSLLITSPDHLPINAHVIKTINFLDGNPAYIITSIP